MSDDEIRKLLDEVPAPAVRPVDVPAILAAAHARAVWKWKACAGAAAALAAGVLAYAGFTRPGPVPTAQAVSAEDKTGARLALLEAKLAEADAKLARLDAAAKAEAARSAELKDLLLVVAADVSRLDSAQADGVDREKRLADWVSARLRDVDGSLADVKKDNTAIYTLVTDRK